MNSETFCEHFATFADAPNGVEKLRQLILQLAVQGKLVRQDENDEPAQKLLNSLRREKDALVGSGALRRRKDGATSNLAHVPFALPNNWTWGQLEDFGAQIPNAIVDGPFGSNLLLSDYDPRGTYPVLTISNLDDGFDLKRIRKINQTKFDQLKRSAVNPGDILVAKIGSSYGKSGLYPDTMPVGIIPANLLKVTIHPALNRQYVLLYLKSDLFRKQLEPIVKFTAQPAFNVTTFKTLLIPFPPLAEQRRIVEKVDQLLGLCDELAARQAAQRVKRQRLVGATLDRLVSTRNPAEFPTHAHRLRNHFDQLFDTTIPQLRQTILQLAVQGQLVPQDPDDEPAATLIARIAKKLGAQNDAKRGKRNGSASEESPHLQPHDLPSSWCWARFDQIATIASNLVPPKDFADLPHVAPDNIEKGTGRLLPYQTVAEDDVRSGNHRFYAGQILYSKIRPNLSKATIVDFDGLCSADMYPINSHIDPDFLLRFILSRTFLSMAVRNDTRVAMPKINQEELNRILIAVPPLSEQKRIVTKVTELLSLCDALEAKLTQAESASTQLLSAAVHHLLHNSPS